jgi:UDP-N-acetylglucosamine--N-acetylmuramyl-(pentapeptide) pyrophosphoryl-undecaprenol N-acetylglucosamine transferase
MTATPLPHETDAMSDNHASSAQANPAQSALPTILFAGGGTGGHIFPSLAIVDRMREMDTPFTPHFLVSTRALDSQIMAKHRMDFTMLSVQPLSVRPWKWPAFIKGWFNSLREVKQMMRQRRVVAVVAMGGFVSAPAAIAAKELGVPVILVNLDAVPGKANMLLKRYADEILTVYRTPKLPNTAIQIGLPLRRSVIGPEDRAEARRQLGLLPDREVLFVTGASSGATSINKLMLELVNHPVAKRSLQDWQVFHLCGGKAEDADEYRGAYDRAGIPAKVEFFCDTMGLAWRAASLAISRAGAGSVAEVWANATPTIFLPYPYHKDQHQKLNAEPLVKTGSALMFSDLVDPAANVKQLMGPLTALMSNASRREHMSATLREKQPPDGADLITRKLAALASKAK